MGPPSPPYPDSYYAATAHTAPAHPQLSETLDCDVCIVGGGLAGCSTALHLAERGYDTVLLEGERIGWGASGRSGGQMIFGFSSPMSKLATLLGAPSARRLWNMSLEALDLSRGLMARYAIDCDYKPGHLHAAIKPRHHHELAEWKRELEDRYDYSGVRLIDGEELRSLLATERYCSGLYDPNSGHVHPLNYALGLARAARQAGARLFEASRVLSLDYSARPSVTTERGQVRCRYLVICCNAYIGELVPAMRARIMPVGSYIVATEPLGAERARALVRNDMAVADVQFILDYFRLSADHRLLFGGRVSYSTVEPPGLTRSLRSRMLRVFPQLADVSIDYTWGGFVDITMNRAPDFGRLANDVYFLQGFSGHGLALTGLAGKLIAEAVTGTAERFDLFARIPHARFPGGRALRTPALVLAMLYYRLRDLL